MRRAANRGLRHRQGQALVEFALIATIFTLFLAGAVDLGRAFSAAIDLNNMARAGAQYGAIATYFDVTDQTQVKNGMKAAALKEQATIFGVAPTVTPSLGEDAAGRCIVSVTVTYNFKPIMRVPPIPSSITMTRTATMRNLYIPPDSSCT